MGLQVPLDYRSTTSDGVRYHTIERPKGRRLVISHCQKRAEKDAHDRQQAIEKLRSKIEKSPSPQQFVTNSTYKKYLRFPRSGEVTLNQAAIDASARWDGIHGVMTNIIGESPETVLSHYHGLWQVEESFRIQKHDLKVRPIFHWKPYRIRAHLAIAFMAFCCARHLEYRVKLQYKMLSPEVIRRELNHVQVSLLQHQTTKNKYAMPSAVSHHAAKIYQVMGVKPRATAYPVK